MAKLKYVTAIGKTQTLREWAEELGLSYCYVSTLNSRGELVPYIEAWASGKSGRKPRKRLQPGDVVGRLTILEVSEDAESAKALNASFVRCRCSCGTECSIRYRNLVKKDRPTQSCGCLQREKTASRNVVDLTGKTFGNLRVISRAGSKNGYACWEVEAPNGRRSVATSAALRSGAFTGAHVLRDLPNPSIPDTRLGRVYKNLFMKRGGFASWEEFEEWAIGAGYTEHSICVRIDPNKPFSRNNATFKSKALYVTAAGKTQSLSQWAQSFGISRQRVHQLNSAGKLEQYIEKRLAESGSAHLNGSCSRDDVLRILKIPHSLSEISELCGCDNAEQMKREIVDLLVDEGVIEEYTDADGVDMYVARTEPQSEESR